MNKSHFYSFISTFVSQGNCKRAHWIASTMVYSGLLQGIFNMFYVTWSENSLMCFHVWKNVEHLLSGLYHPVFLWRYRVNTMLIIRLYSTFMFHFVHELHTVTLTFSWKIISLSLLMCGFHTTFWLVASYSHLCCLIVIIIINSCRLNHLIEFWFIEHHLSKYNVSVSFFGHIDFLCFG